MKWTFYQRSVCVCAWLPSFNEGPSYQDDPRISWLLVCGTRYWSVDKIFIPLAKWWLMGHDSWRFKAFTSAAAVVATRAACSRQNRFHICSTPLLQNFLSSAAAQWTDRMFSDYKTHLHQSPQHSSQDLQTRKKPKHLERNWERNPFSQIHIQLQ